mmetsp:Transcript_33147/g.75767  ORF Transcript_33147/g.75767 Transcript_33147/m.75767 type:complete len:348 (-) Transcript_33147:173-1216(-)
MVLDGKRSNAIGIMLAKLPPITEIKNAILEADEETLDYDQLLAISMNLPTIEEVSLVKAAHGSGAPLDKPEKFVLLLSSIPKLAIRISVWLFKMTFVERSQDLKPPLKSCLVACRQVRESVALKLVLGTVLSLGNYLNGGTCRGQADGFKMDFFPKFKDTKDVTNKVTLFHYAIDVAVNKFPQAMLLTEELRLVRPASKVSLEDLSRDVTKLSNDTALAKKQLATILGGHGGREGDAFAKSMQEFLAEAEGIVSQVSDLLGDAAKAFADLVEYFGYPPKHKVKSEEFFPVIRDLVEDFKTVVSQVFRGDPKEITDLMKSGAVGETIGGGVVGDEMMQSRIESIRHGG